MSALRKLLPRRSAAAAAGRYAPRLWPVWIVLRLALVVAGGAGYGIYALLRHFTDPKETVLDVVRAAVGVAAFFGAVLAGVYAYRKQRLAEGDAKRSDAEQLATRYTTAAKQLGHEKAAVRLAGVYAMARLADDWPEERQTCIDVLCAYLRIPYDPNPESGKHKEGEREVRQTIIGVIRDHLQEPNAATSWCGRDLDFRGAVFDGGSFAGAKFTGGSVSFLDTQFPLGVVQFIDVEVSGGDINFSLAKLTGGGISFIHAEFTGGEVSFFDARFSDGKLALWDTKFSDGEIDFSDAEFTGGEVSFSNSKLSGGDISFYGAKFSGGKVDFHRTTFTGGKVSFPFAKFSGGDLSFTNAKFSGGEVVFCQVELSGGRVSFPYAEFSGGDMDFSGADFTGGEVDFRGVSDWSHPPHFDFSEPPPGVLLPPQQADVSAPASASGIADEPEARGAGSR
jgi:uncharacterized protein YjbI with pentapeptide repeats